MSDRTIRQMIFNWTVFRRAAIVFGILGLIAVLAFFMWFKAVTREVPSIEQLADYEPPITSRVHAGDGALIAEFAEEHRVFVPYESIPTHVVHAFVSAEDKTFFEHGGIDYRGMLRGLINSVKNKITNSGGLQGGSTITQQVAKNFVLTNEQTLTRKAKEAEIAWRMEKIYSKEKIMELYLNEIYLGGRSYGVGSAALNYFDKSLPELNISEAAILASLAKAPGTVNPYRRPERLLQRRSYVLNRMVEDGYITKEQADAAKALPLETKRRLRGAEYDAATYFREEVRRELVKEYGEDALYQGGLSVRSTIDTRLQLAAQEALQSGLEAYDRRHEYRGPFANISDADNKVEALNDLRLPGGSGNWEGGMVQSVSAEGATLLLEDGATVSIPADDVTWATETYTAEDGKTGLRAGDVVLVELTREEQTNGDGEDAEITYLPVGEGILRQVPLVDGALIALDPHTGRVLAMAGGYSFYKSQFNRVTQARRQPGSSFKPFVYAAALENGYTPSSRVLDAPYVEFDIEQDDYWAPGNYVKGKWEGLTTMRIGLEKSRNLMTVRMAKDIGLETVSEIGERFGLYDKLPPYTAMSLGAGETSLWRLAKGYAAFVNGGREVTPTLLDRVQNRHGETLFRHDQRDCSACEVTEWSDESLPPIFDDSRKQLVDPITAFQVVNMLEGVVQRGTGRRALRVGKPLAGKTGTTNDYVDALFFGFSPDLVVGVWVGFDQPKSLGDGEAGGSVSAPIFTEFMQAALADADALPFRIPPGVRLVNIDSKTGQLPGPETNPRDIVMEAYRPGTEPGAVFGDDEDLNSIFGDANLFDGPSKRQVNLPIGEQNGPRILLDENGNPVLDENGNPILLPPKGKEVDPEDEAADGDFDDTY